MRRRIGVDGANKLIAARGHHAAGEEEAVAEASQAVMVGIDGRVHLTIHAQAVVAKFTDEVARAADRAQLVL